MSLFGNNYATTSIFSPPNMSGFNQFQSVNNNNNSNIIFGNQSSTSSLFARNLFSFNDNNNNTPNKYEVFTFNKSESNNIFSNNNSVRFSFNNNNNFNSNQNVNTKFNSVGFYFNGFSITEKTGNANFSSITSLPEYENLSFEEIKYNDYIFAKTVKQREVIRRIKAKQQ